MKTHYRIAPPDRQPMPTEQEIARYRDPKRLIYNYQRAVGMIHRRPLYKDPKAFLALLIIILVTILVVEAGRKERGGKELVPVEQEPGS